MRRSRPPCLPVEFSVPLTPARCVIIEWHTAGTRVAHRAHREAHVVSGWLT
jgi:hypothetical protein